MKNFKMLVTLGFAVLVMSACGDKSGASGTASGNSCAVGSVSTAQGCMPSGNCPT